MHILLRSMYDSVTGHAVVILDLQLTPAAVGCLSHPLLRKK